MEATSIKFGIAHYLHPLPGKGKARVKGTGSDPNNPTRTEEGRRPTLASSTGHPNRLNPDPPATRPGTMGVEYM